MAEMTPQNALKVIDKAHDYPCPYGIGGTAWLTIRNCIEKQIPKKTIEKFPFDVCPVCDRIVSASMAYCSGCGQKLDWSDKE